MNFKNEYKKGQEGGNKGIHIHHIEGLTNISTAINGVQKSRIYVVGAAPKVGKTTFTDAFFLLGLYLSWLQNPFPLEWIYFSFEINRIEKEFEIAAFFLFYDFNIKNIKLPKNIKKNGENTIEMSSDYLMGRILDDNGNLITVSKEIEEKMKIVYLNRIVPLFGVYDEQGKQKTKGLVTFIKDRDNPTGLKKFLENHAQENGEFIKSSVYGNNRTAAYKPKDPNKYTIVITDHLRKIHKEQGLSLKDTVDKFSAVTCDYRDWCGYTFVHVIHTNRTLANIENIKFLKENLYPTSENVKETGNLSEDANYLFTMMNPNDEKYNLKSHFGVKIKDDSGNLYHPNLRTIHLVESRHCFYPQHFSCEMIGGIKYFKKLSR